MTPAAKQIFDDVLNRYRLAQKDIAGKSQQKILVRARVEIANRLRNELKYSYGKISLLLNRDSTTIVFYCGNLSRQLPACLKSLGGEGQ